MGTFQMNLSQRAPPQFFPAAVLEETLQELRGVSQKFSASYIKKHSTTAMNSLFFCIISANFNAFIPSFLHLLYSSLVENYEEFFLPLKEVLHRVSDVTVTQK